MPDILKVSEVVSRLDLRETMIAAEFGCGSADFSLHLARKLTRGRVYALDIQEEKLSALKGKMAHENVRNITTAVCDLEAKKGSGLQDDFLDVVLITNVLFQAENKYTMIEEAARVTKTGGQILVVDWFKIGPFSPKTGMILPKEVKEMAQKLGLSLKNEFAIGDYHYGLVFIK